MPASQFNYALNAMFTFGAFFYFAVNFKVHFRKTEQKTSKGKTSRKTLWTRLGEKIIYPSYFL